MLDLYDFNAIVFSHKDATTWSHVFLSSRLEDPQWAPVFMDSRVLILLRRTEQNAMLIKRFEIPRGGNPNTPSPEQGRLMEKRPVLD